MNKQMKKNKKGFTLVEMIVVIAIIGVLAAMMVPSLLGYIKKSNIASNNASAAAIGRAAVAIIAENPTILADDLKVEIPKMVDGKGKADVSIDTATNKVTVKYEVDPGRLTISTLNMASGATIAVVSSSEKVGYYPQ